MDTYWIPGINRAATYGRWAFAEFTDVYTLQDDFAAAVRAQTRTGQPAEGALRTP